MCVCDALKHCGLLRPTPGGGVCWNLFRGCWKYHRAVFRCSLMDSTWPTFLTICSEQSFPALAAHREPWRATLGSSPCSLGQYCQSPRSKGHGWKHNHAAPGTGARPWRPLECDSFLHSFFSSINKVNRKGFLPHSGLPALDESSQHEF